MFEENSHMNSLAVRKQLLIVESELNRRLLIDAWQSAGAMVCYKSLVNFFLFAGLKTLGQENPAEGKQSSWLRAVIKGVSWFGSFLPILRILRRRKREE